MAQPPSDASEVCHLITQIVTWLIVVGGWLIVNSQNNGRERRKEVRQAFDKLCTKIEEVEYSARTFHQNIYNAEAADKLKLSIDKIIRAIARLEVLDSKILSHNAIHLRKSITLNNFDTSNHVPLNGTHPQLADISNAAEKLIGAIESAYAKRYLH